MTNLESYILLFISVSIIIAATTSLGLAAEPSVEVTVTDVGWNEIVTSNGTIGISGISINVTNNSLDTFKNFQICAQLNSTAAALSDIACADTGTLSPFSQSGFTKEGLSINFVNNLQVSELNILSLNATSKSQLATTVAAEQDITIKSDEVTITFENILNAGTVNISAVDADDVSNTIARIETTNQIVVSVGGIDMTSVSTVVEINTTAEHTGEILIVIPYDETLIPSGVSESEIKLLRFTNGVWVDVTSSIDTSANTVSGSVTGFSQFMAGVPSAPSAPSAPSTPSASPSAGGGGGKFGSAGGGGGGAYSSTIVLFEVHLYQVSWDTCNNNIMTVIAGPPSGGLGVKLRTAESGLVTVTLAEDQPYANKFVFEGQIEPTESFVMVQVEAISGRGAQIVQEYIDINECFGTIIFEKEPSVPVSPTTPTPTPSVPIHVPFHTMAPKISEGITYKISNNDANFEINGKMDTGIIKEMYVEDGASKLGLLGTSVVPESTLLLVSILLITLVSVIVMTRLKTLQEVL